MEKKIYVVDHYRAIDFVDSSNVSNCHTNITPPALCIVPHLYILKYLPSYCLVLAHSDEESIPGYHTCGQIYYDRDDNAGRS